MTTSKELIKKIGTKLKADTLNTEYKGPDGDLYYVMDIRLQDAIKEAMYESGYDGYEPIVSMASKASRKFLQGIIDLSERNV